MQSLDDQESRLHLQQWKQENLNFEEYKVLGGRAVADNFMHR